MTIAACPYHPDETTPSQDVARDGVLCLGCGFPALACPHCGVANRFQANFCRACGKSLTRPLLTFAEKEVLAGLWEEAAGAINPPAKIPLPVVGDTITSMARAAGFLLVGTRGGRVFALNAFSPSLICVQAEVSGAVLGFLEWNGLPPESGRKGLAPGVIVTTVAGLFHLPFVDGKPQGPLWPVGDRFSAPSVFSGERLIAFPEVGGRVTPTALEFEAGRRDPVVRTLHLSVFPPISGPVRFGTEGCVFLSQDQALVFEPGAPDLAYAVELGLEPDLFVPPTAFDGAIFYVYQESSRRGVARLVPGEWTSYTLLRAEHPLLQVAAASKRALAIGTDRDLQLISSTDGHLIWSRALHAHQDTFSHDASPILRFGEHLLFSSTGANDVVTIDVVPLSEAGFNAGPREVLRPGALEGMPFVIPGGLVVPGAGELQILRPVARP